MIIAVYTARKVPIILMRSSNAYYKGPVVVVVVDSSIASTRRVSSFTCRHLSNKHCIYGS